MTIDDESNEKLSIEFVDDCVFVSNSSFHFFGAYFKSENGKYILAWRENSKTLDGDDEVSEGDDQVNCDNEHLTEAEEKLYTEYLEQEFKEGFLLLEDQKIILKVFLSRPTYGKVAIRVSRHMSADDN